MPIDYENELQVLQPKRRGRVPKPKSSKKTVTLEEAIKTLQDLGFDVSIPSTEQDRHRQKSSLAALGFESASRGVESKPSGPTRLTGTLITSHSIGGNTYGPGLLDLPVEQEDLFRTLLQQDQSCVRAHMDTVDYIRNSRCYLIQPGRSEDKKNKFSKVEVSEAVFNSDAFLGNTGIVAGAMDVAGTYSSNPNGVF